MTAKHLAITLVDAWGVIEADYGLFFTLDHDDHICVRKGSIGRIIDEKISAHGLKLKVIRFPGNIFVTLGPTAYVLVDSD